MNNTYLPGVRVKLIRLAAIAVFVPLATYSLAQERTEIFVLSTLHQHHGRDNAYTFSNLSEIVEAYRPDVIAVELTPADLDSRKAQKTKQEYQNSIFPSADRLNIPMIPMEPPEPLFGELVGLIRASDTELREQHPDAGDSFSKYLDSLYAYLFEYWKSASEVNSERTDALFEVKHGYQNDLFGEQQKLGWEGWNTHFLNMILEAAEANQGKRIMVIVGAEHSYWLRQKLRLQDGVRLIEPEAVLK